MCKFCETIGNHILERSLYLDLYIKVEENDLPRIVAVETDDAHETNDVYYCPKFCPECGRKLY